jgi:hypothetical protein
MQIADVQFYGVRAEPQVLLEVLDASMVIDIFRVIRKSMSIVSTPIESTPGNGIELGRSWTLSGMPY